MSVTNAELFISSFSQSATGDLIHSQLLKQNEKTSVDFVSKMHADFNQRKARAFFDFSEEDELADANESMIQSFASSNENLDALHDKIKHALPIVDFCQQGYAVVSKYESLATQYLQITIVESSNQFTLGDDLQLLHTNTIDGTRLHMAARFNLTDMSTEGFKSAITVVKKSVSSKYKHFMERAFNAIEMNNTKTITKNLIKAVESFAQSDEFEAPAEARQLIKEEAAKYCRENSANGRSIVISEMSGAISPDSASFEEHFKSIHEEPVSEVSVQTNKLTALTEYQGAGGGLKISFNEKLLDEKVFYDAGTDRLVIVDIPPNLRDQLLRNKVGQDKKKEQDIHV